MPQKKQAAPASNVADNVTEEPKAKTAKQAAPAGNAANKVAAEPKAKPAKGKKQAAPAGNVADNVVEKPQAEPAQRKKQNKKPAKKQQTASVGNVANKVAAEPKAKPAKGKKQAVPAGQDAPAGNVTSNAAEEPKAKSAPKKKQNKRPAKKQQAAPARDVTPKQAAPAGNVAPDVTEESKVESAPKKKQNKKPAKKQQTASARNVAPDVTEEPKVNPAKQTASAGDVTPNAAEEPKVNPAKGKKQNKKPAKKQDAPENKAATDSKPEPEVKKVPSLPLYGKISPVGKKPETAKKTEAPKKSETKPEKPLTQIYGKITVPAKTEKKSAAVPFNRDRVFAEVFGYAYAPQAAPSGQAAPAGPVTSNVTEEPKDKPAQRKKQKNQPAKKREEATSKPVVLTPAMRDEIFAAVFGYEPEKKAPKGEEKKKAPQQPGKAAERRKSYLFSIFTNKGRKKRPDFKWVKKVPVENEAEEAPAAEAKPAEPFNRDRIFAEVFGYAFEEAALKPAAPAPEKKQKKESVPPAGIDADLAQLISASFTGDYPKLNIRKPFTESEKRWARDFESFYASRGQKVSFKTGGATKTGIITEKLLKSGSAADVLAFFNAAKRALAPVLELKDEELMRSLLSGSNPSAAFAPGMANILNTAQSFGLITKFVEQKDEKGEVTRLRAFFSKYPNVVKFFMGEFLESYGYFVAEKVAKKVAQKHGVRCEVAANLLTTDESGRVVHEYDTVLRVSNQVFIIEEKSSQYFCDFNKFAQDMDRLQFNKKNYMILLINKTGEEAEAVEWLFDFRVANLETFASKLEQMIEESLSDPVPEV